MTERQAVDRVRQAELGADFARRHTDPELLVLVNVWGVASTEAVAAAPGCRALATASAAVAAAFGYPDHEQIPVELMLDQLARIAAISYGPYPQRRLLTGLTDLAGQLHAGESFPHP